MLKYLFHIIIGIILYILINSIEKFNIGIPQQIRIRFTYDLYDRENELRIVSLNLIYNPETENVEYHTNEGLPPGMQHFSPITNALQIQNLLIQHIIGAIYQLFAMSPESTSIEDEHNLNEYILNEIRGVLLSFDEISLNNIDFIIWLLDTDNSNMTQNIIDFRNMLRQLITNDINIEFINTDCASSRPTKRKRERE